MRGPSCSIHKLVADVAVIAEGRVLLVKYKDVSRYDGQTGWFLPDDYLVHGEAPREAARRILREQSGISVDEPRLGDVESLDGDGGPWHLIFHFIVRLARAGTVVPGANVAAAEWFPLDRLPKPEDLAHGGWAADVLRGLLKPEK